MTEDERLEDPESEEPADEEESLEPGAEDEEAEPAEEEEAEEEDSEPSDDEASVADQVRSLKAQFDDASRRFDTEIKRLQNENAYYRARYEEPARGKSGAAEEEAPPPVSDDDWYKSPVEATRKLLQWEIERDRKKKEGEAQVSRQDLMRRAYGYGRDAALKAYPKLVRGIERELEEYVFSNIRGGRITDPQDLANPETWAIAAESLRRSKGELDFSKYYSSTPPMATEAPYSEIPAGRRPSPGRPRLDDEARIFIEEINRGEKKKITEEDIFGRSAPRKPNPFRKPGGGTK